MNTITTDGVMAMFELAAERIAQARDELTALDAAIGDADHGVNLERGFAAIMPRLRGLDDPEIGMILRTAGSTLVSVVGGASGPLYGTALLRMATVLAGRREIDLPDLVLALQAGLDGIMARGRAVPGEKTMIDTIAPAVAALEQAIQQGATLSEALQSMVVAGEAGMRSTIPMLATKGRASYLGERSIGHQDAGATSAYYLLLAFQQAVAEAADGTTPMLIRSQPANP